MSYIVHLFFILKILKTENYDANGNMTKDFNKGIDLIKYNHLNLPTEINFVNGNKIYYLYNAVGQKLNKQVTAGSTTKQTDYLSGFQYDDQVLMHFSHAEGYVQHVEGVFKYVYNYTDHLGNIRLSYSYDDDSGMIRIMEENHYYPFGLKHTAYNTEVLEWEEVDDEVLLNQKSSSSYKYKYNGKEYQDELGLNMYDYGARNYDPALGRWMNVDPLAEKFPSWSPYCFVMNNPLRLVDPDGRAPVDWIKNKASGKFEWRNEVTSSSNTPEGYSYVGKDDSSIVNNLFGNSSFKESSLDSGTISVEDFDNPYSATGAAASQIATKTTLSVFILADVKTKYNKSGDIISKDFQGVKINTTVSGKTSAPSTMNIKLRGDSMTFEGNEMKRHQPSTNGEFIQGGDVPSLTYNSYLNSSFIQNNYGKKADFNFNFDGQYFDGNNLRSMTGPTILGIIPIENSTNVNLTVPFSNEKK